MTGPVEQFLAGHFDTRFKKPRVGVWEEIARPDCGDVLDREAAHPITGRGVGYKLFTTGLIPSMSTADMQRVYRLLKEARERGIIPWGWIVDESRALERSLQLERCEGIRKRRHAIVSTRLLVPATVRGSKSGRRKAPCAACSSRCLTSTESAFG